MYRTFATLLMLTGLEGRPGTERREARPHAPQPACAPIAEDGAEFSDAGCARRIFGGMRRRLAAAPCSLALPASLITYEAVGLELDRSLVAPALAGDPVDGGGREPLEPPQQACCRGHDYEPAVLAHGCDGFCGDLLRAGDDPRRGRGRGFAGAAVHSRLAAHDPFHHGGRDEAGTHGGDPERAPAVLGSERLGEADQAVFAGLVGRDVARAHQAENAADVHQMRILRAQKRRQQLASQLNGRSEIDRHHSIPLLVGHAVRWTVKKHTRIVDQDVEVTPAREQSAYGGADLGRLAKIAACGDDFDTPARGPARRELHTRSFDIYQVYASTLTAAPNPSHSSLTAPPHA